MKDTTPIILKVPNSFLTEIEQLLKIARPHIAVSDNGYLTHLFTENVRLEKRKLENFNREDQTL